MVELPVHRFANKILENFKSQNETWVLRKSYERISEMTQELQQLTKLFTRAIHKQWLASAAHLKMNIDYIADDIEYHTKSIKPDVSRIIAGLRNYPTQLELIEDLKAIKQEFGNLLYDPEDLCMTVYSKDIIFDDVNLGSFELKIPINTRYNPAVVACDPNRPQRDEATTHPHVQDDVMCLGNGRDQFYDAVRQGRVFDAFTILNSVLVTYNPDSAYVKIENWDGNSEDYITCNDCGDDTNTEETTTCNNCENYYCNHCTYECGACGEMQCEYCMKDKCSICKNKPLCKKCTYKCKTCSEIFCNNCINNPEETIEEQNCANCQKDLDEGLETEVRPECVGQIMLPTG